MAARKFKLIEDSFTTGYTTAGPLWRGSRAENVHRGRSGIDRRRHRSLCLDSELAEALQKHESKTQAGGNSEQRRQTFATQTKAAASGNQQQRREEYRGSPGFATGRESQFSETTTTRRNFEQDRPRKEHTSTNRGVQVSFEDDRGDRSWRQQNESFVDERSRNVRPPRESSYYSEDFRSSGTPFDSLRGNMKEIRQRSAYEDGRQERDFRDSGQHRMNMHSGQPSFQTDGGVWQPVRVVYGEKSPRETNQSRTLPRSRDYSTSGYGYESKEAASRYPTRSYSEDWDGRQWEDGYENRSYPAAYETHWNGSTNGFQRQMQSTPPYKSREGSYHRSTEVLQSRDNPSSSDWNGNYKTVSMPPQQLDYIDGITSSRSRAYKTGSGGREFGYPTRMESTTYSQNGTSRTEGLNPGLSGLGNASYVTYRSESLGSPRMLHSNRADGPAFGVRSQGEQVPIVHYDEVPQSSRRNYSRSSGKELNGERSSGTREDFVSRRTTAGDDDKEFLGKLMKELENQRANLKPEVDKLIRSSSLIHDDYDLDSRMNSVTLEAGKNSYIDTSSSTPVFKAYVDIKEFSPKSVKINFDQLTNKVVVEASQVDARGTVGKTFTQKIALPRYADDLRLVARMNSNGVLRIEVPLLFYFPENPDDNKAKAFLNEARRNSTDGSEEVEIIVRPGRDYSIDDIYPEVINDTLVIWGGKGKEKKAINKFVLPTTANVQNIKQRFGMDGCLAVVIPIT